MKSFFEINKKIESIFVLIDPDKINVDLLTKFNEYGFRKFLVGGSVLKSGDSKKTIQLVRKHVKKSTIFLFPGDKSQLAPNADGLLLPVLLSGQNPEYFLGQHIQAAKKIKEYKLKSYPTGYILIRGGKKSSTEKITGTEPMSDPKIIEQTAIAGELIGMKFIYLEAGSGAKKYLAKANP